MPSETGVHIAIVGAGVAGLTLANLLHKHDIPADIFERDTSPHARDQGGTLDLKVETGQAALKIADLFAEFQAVMRLDGQDTRVAMKDGVFLIDFKAKEGDTYNPEVDRAALKDLLLKRVANQVKWGANVSSIQKASQGGYLVTFKDGSSSAYDLVIGADGSHSKTRPYVSEAREKYCGVTFVESTIKDAETSHPEQSATVGKGTLYAQSDGKAIVAQENGDGSIRVYAAIPVHESWVKERNFDDRRTLQDEILSYYSDWNESLTSLITAGSGPFRPWQIYALPVGHRWAHKPGLTLIGDAAHVMSPHAGEGANVSMLDGAKLGQAIVSGLNNGKLEEEIEKFEEDMFKRAEVSAARSDRNLKGALSGKMTAEDTRKHWEYGLKMRS